MALVGCAGTEDADEDKGNPAQSLTTCDPSN